MNKQSMLKLSALALAASLVASLAGCGGGSDEAEPTPVPAPAPAPVPAPVPAPTPATPTGSATGVFSDAPVEGLAYSAAPSGVSGNTNALGQFTYNPGDSVSFKLGTLSLGAAVPAAATVTPIELAAGSADKLKNLLVLLQSLDSDGVPANGITIPAKSAEAVTASIDLSQAPASFASSANAGLTAAMAAGGNSRAITDNAAADAHFLAQAKQLLSRHIWVAKYADANGAGIHIVRFGSAGEYLNLSVGTDNGRDITGVEYGTATATLVDARGFKLTAKVDIDTNGEEGLSHIRASERVRVEGEKLVAVEAPSSGSGADDIFTLAKAENDPKGLVGVWAGSSDVIKTQTFVFWADGKYAMIDPEGDDGPSKCGGPGVEYGDYSYDTSSKVFTVLKVSHDTNGCAGLSNLKELSSFTFTLSADGSSATLVFPGEGEFKAFRVSN